MTSLAALGFETPREMSASTPPSKSVNNLASFEESRQGRADEDNQIFLSVNPLSLDGKRDSNPQVKSIQENIKRENTADTTKAMLSPRSRKTYIFLAGADVSMGNDIQLLAASVQKRAPDFPFHQMGGRCVSHAVHEDMLWQL